MKVYLMRHGQTDWNAENRMQGRQDIPLNEKGTAQARQAAEGMRGIPFDCILSSPLQRACRTAEIIAQITGLSLPVIKDDRLMEMNFGTMEGTDRETNAAAKCFFQNPADYVADETAESLEQLETRCRNVLEELLAPLEGRCQNVLVCSHGAFIQGIVQYLLQRPAGAFWSDPPQPNCSCTILACQGGKFTLLERGHVFAAEGGEHGREKKNQGERWKREV